MLDVLQNGGQLIRLLFEMKSRTSPCRLAAPPHNIRMAAFRSWQSPTESVPFSSQPPSPRGTGNDNKGSSMSPDDTNALYDEMRALHQRYLPSITSVAITSYLLAGASELTYG